jgi:hypothetical protein
MGLVDTVNRGFSGGLNFGYNARVDKDARRLAEETRADNEKIGGELAGFLSYLDGTEADDGVSEAPATPSALAPSPNPNQHDTPGVAEAASAAAATPPSPTTALAGTAPPTAPAAPAGGQQGQALDQQQQPSEGDTFRQKFGELSASIVQHHSGQGNMQAGLDIIASLEGKIDKAITRDLKGSLLAANHGDWPTAIKGLKAAYAKYPDGGQIEIQKGGKGAWQVYVSDESGQMVMEALTPSFIEDLMMQQKDIVEYRKTKGDEKSIDSMINQKAGELDLKKSVFKQELTAFAHKEKVDFENISINKQLAFVKTFVAMKQGEYTDARVGLLEKQSDLVGAQTTAETVDTAITLQGGGSPSMTAGALTTIAGDKGTVVTVMRDDGDFSEAEDELMFPEDGSVGMARSVQSYVSALPDNFGNADAKDTVREALRVLTPILGDKVNGVARAQQILMIAAQAGKTVEQAMAAVNAAQAAQ